MELLLLVTTPAPDVILAASKISVWNIIIYPPHYILPIISLHSNPPTPHTLKFSVASKLIFVNDGVNDDVTRLKTNPPTWNIG